MTVSSIRVSAPGSFMLMGEHAVLEGREALVCAHHQRVYVTLRTSPQGFRVTSDRWGSFPLETAPADFGFVQKSVALYRSLLTEPLHIEISSEASDQKGFGTSAAVTVAVVGALEFYTNPSCPFNPSTIFDQSCTVVRAIQGVGSGSDVAASTWGGIVHMKNHRPHKMRAPYFPLVAVYSGVKLKTADVVRFVQGRMRLFPSVYRALYDVSDVLIQKAVVAIMAQDHKTLGALMNVHQGLMESYGVTTQALQEIVRILQQSTHGAKISGSGLGDCAIGLGSTEQVSDFEVIPIHISDRGVSLEEA